MPPTFRGARMEDDNRLFAKPVWRLLPFLGLLYFVSFLDRVNVGFAALTMNADLGFTAEAYGFGAGIFFLAYSALEVPSNVLLERVGARLWIFRIMLTWGLLSAATAFVYDETSFYLVRFLLGAAEAGFFPGIIFYLACWFPAGMRARMVAGFMAAVPLAGDHRRAALRRRAGLDGFWGLAGWKWLFLIEGVPAVLLAFVVLRVAARTGRPMRKWLDRRRAGCDRRAAWRASRRRPISDLGRRLRDIRGLASGAALFRHRADAVRAQFLAAADRQGRWASPIFRPASSSRCPMCWRPRRWCCGAAAATGAASASVHFAAAALVAAAALRGRRFCRAIWRCSWR